MKNEWQKLDFVVGDSVAKIVGDYKFEGTVRAIFTKRDPAKVRVVVENADGILHIFNPQQLRLIETRTCPKCGLVTEAKEGDGACPVYHGMAGDGTCPLHVDGKTAEQEAADARRHSRCPICGTDSDVHHTTCTRVPPPSITCPRCGMTSYHPKDIEQRYCGRCNRFHELLYADDRIDPSAADRPDH